MLRYVLRSSSYSERCTVYTYIGQRYRDPYTTCERRRVGGGASKLDPEEILGRKKEEEKKRFFVST